MYLQDKSSAQPQSTETSELSAKLEKVEELERQIEDQKFKISQLREEKVRLEKFYSCLSHHVLMAVIQLNLGHSAPISVCFLHWS